MVFRLMVTDEHFESVRQLAQEALSVPDFASFQDLDKYLQNNRCVLNATGKFAFHCFAGLPTKANAFRKQSPIGKRTDPSERGLSMFIPFNDNRNRAVKYAHERLKATLLSCESNENHHCYTSTYPIYGLNKLAILCDRLLFSENAAALHVLVVSTAETESSNVVEVATCKNKAADWKPCMMEAAAAIFEAGGHEDDNEEILAWKDYPDVFDPCINAAIRLLEEVCDSDEFDTFERFSAALFQYILADEQDTYARNPHKIAAANNNLVASLLIAGHKLYQKTNDHNPFLVDDVESLMRIVYNVYGEVNDETFEESIQNIKGAAPQ